MNDAKKSRKKLLGEKSQKVIKKLDLTKINWYNSKAINNA
jgi:hypothetical protein